MFLALHAITLAVRLFGIHAHEDINTTINLNHDKPVPRIWALNVNQVYTCPILFNYKFNLSQSQMPYYKDYIIYNN